MATFNIAGKRSINIVYETSGKNRSHLSHTISDNSITRDQNKTRKFTRANATMLNKSIVAYKETDQSNVAYINYFKV